MGIRNIAVTITGDGTSLSRALLRGAGEVDRYARRVETTNRRVELSWRNAGLAAAAGVTAAAVAVTAVGVASAQFETRMRNVNSLVHESDAGFRSMSQATLDLTTKLPQSANTLAEGLYDITSSGFAGAEALFILEKSAEAASAGLTTTANAAQAIDAVLNAYGLSAGAAADVSDALFQTMNLGVLRFEDLTGVIADTVGTAAAAKVPISAVGAAIATMTLNGLSASESGTSLNRVLQSLIQPSEALAATYEHLGFESGAAALQSKGLEAVLQDIRTATGGNITTLLQLFPEIRAARGALALMSNEGRTYARVSAGIDDANARQGATQRTLAEQMKATSYQLRLFENQARLAAINVGAHVLPVFVAFLHGTQQLGHEAVPLLQRGISAVTPLFESLYRSGQNLAEITGELFHAIEPLGAALLTIGGFAIVDALTVLAKVLGAVTGVLADHEEVVQALAAVYLATLLPSVTAVTVAFNRFILTPVVLGLANVAAGAGTAAAGIRGLTASMLSLQAVATFGVAVALYAVFRGFSAVHEIQAKAREDIAAVTDDFNALDTRRAQDQIGQLRAMQLKAVETSKNYSGTFGTLRAGLNVLVGDKSIGRIAEDGRQASKSLADLDEKMTNANSNLVYLASTTGLSAESIRQLALANKIDLSNEFYSDKANAARLQVLYQLKDIEKQSGTTGTALEHAAGIDLEAMQALAEAIADVAKRTRQAFERDTDVLGSFDPTAAADDSAKAADKVAAAERRLGDARARAGSHAKETVSDAISIRKAEEALARAQQGVADTANQQSGNLAASYRKTLRLATQFADDVQKAQARGLDPAAITRLLELGPKQAVPILQRLVGDHSGRLIRIVNDSEQALARIGQRVVEQARLTTLATNAATDELTHLLPDALRVSAEALSQGARATTASIAKALKLPPSEVAKIVEKFGLIGVQAHDALQKGLTSKPLVAPSLTVPVRGGYLNDPDRLLRRAGGGQVFGDGTSTSDSILARLSNREYVQPVAAVDYYGVEFMERIRRMQLPRFAGGGLAGGGVVRVDGGSTHSVRNIQEVRGPVIVQGVDMDDALQQLRAKQTRRGWSGGARRD